MSQSAPGPAGERMVVAPDEGRVTADGPVGVVEELEARYGVKSAG